MYSDGVWNEMDIKKNKYMKINTTKMLIMQKIHHNYMKGRHSPKLSSSYMHVLVQKTQKGS